MAHTHHHHQHDNSEGNIKVAFFLNLSFALIEIIGGLWTNSVAILSDALHDLGDSLTLGISWYFARIARRKSDQNFSYGYTRFSVLGALLNSIVLVSGSIFILTEAIPRLLNPINPHTEGMIYLAIGGVLINSAAAFRLSKGKSLNERSVYLHLLEDILGWVAVLIGSIIMHLWHLPIIDPILSIFIATFILYNVLKNLKGSFRIILQGTPSDLDVNQIHHAIAEIPDIGNIVDCHIWTMDGVFHVLSLHICIEKNLSLYELSKMKVITKQKLKHLGINHATIEFETPEEQDDK